MTRQFARLALGAAAAALVACGGGGGSDLSSGFDSFEVTQIDYGNGEAGDDPSSEGTPQPCNEPCTVEKPVCDTGTRTCVQCLDDSQCQAGICLDNVCREDLVCPPGGMSCHNNSVRTCSDDGHLVVSENDCGEKACFQGKCLTCRPGSADCETANMARLCRLDGSDWDFTDCGEQKCVSGLCAQCIPGFKQCEGTKVFQCQSDATSFAQVEDCDTNNTGQKCFLGMCIKMCELNAKFHTNKGCEYWAIDMDNYHDTDPTTDGQNSPYALVVSNTDPEFRALVTIYESTGQIKQVEAPPLTATPIFLPPFNVAGPMKGKMARRLSSTLPIVAYQFNPLENVGVYSNDASLLLPTNVLGKHYMVMSWPTLPGTNSAGQILASNFAVVAADTATTHVKVTVTAKTLGGGGLPVIAAGGTYETDLEPFDVLNFEAGEGFADLTGSTVDADGRVSVFGGHVCANAPISQCVSGKCSYDKTISCSTSTDCPGIAACDHMEEQIQPLVAWGTSYVVARFWPRGNAPDIIRVLAAENDTHVTVAGASITVPVLAKGKFYEFEISSDVEITADKQILIGQFMEGQDAPGSDHNMCAWVDDFTLESGPCDSSKPAGDTCQCYSADGLSLNKSCTDDTACSPGDANIGDPDFLIGVPVEQYRGDYVFLVPIKYSKNYVNIVAEPSAQVTLDGTVIDPSKFKPVGTGTWSAARLVVSEGSHSLTSDRKVGVTVYGWDRYVSYSYPGGMNIETLKVIQ